MNDHQAQLVDDVVWAFESAPFAEGPNTVGAIALDRSAIDPEQLADWIGEPPRRVGKYYERIVQFGLEHVLGFDLVGAAIQLFDGKRTIGELDFVFRDLEGVTTHWETAVKFFLHDPARPGSHYPGPNARDDYETKIAKLFDEQLPRSDGHDPEIAVRGAHVRGCCFHHPDNVMPTAFPERMPVDCERGTWRRGSQVPLLGERWADERFVILDKPYWLTPGRRPRLTFDELVHHANGHFAHHQAAIMVAVVDGGETPEPLQHRICLVDETW